MSAGSTWAWLLLVTACASTTTSNRYLSVESEPAGAVTRLTLRPVAGARINARLKPALERRDGSVLRFDSPRVTTDSAYYTAPPVLVVEGDPTGVVRASVCPEGERVCRQVEVRVSREK